MLKKMKSVSSLTFTLHASIFTQLLVLMPDPSNLLLKKRMQIIDSREGKHKAL